MFRKLLGIEEGAMGRGPVSIGWEHSPDRDAGGPSLRDSRSSAPSRRVAPAPEEPLAVVVAGADASGRGSVLATLLDHHVGPLVAKPPTSYLVVTYAPVPHLQVEVPEATVAAGRPPRRVEATLADPLLRHFSLVEAPSTDRLGPAGVDVFLDVACRGGTVLYAIGAGSPLCGSEVAVLSALADLAVPVHFVLTPDHRGDWAVDNSRTAAAGRRRSRSGGRSRRSEPGRVVRSSDARLPADPVGAALAAHAAAVSAQVPAMSTAAWHAVDPAAADATFLRRALLDWSATESLRRASGIPVRPAAATEPFKIPPLATPDWRLVLDRVWTAGAEAGHEYMRAELDELRLRWVGQPLPDVSGPELLQLIDDELYGVSCRLVARLSDLVGTLLHDLAAEVLPTGSGQESRDGLSRAVGTAIPVDALANAVLIDAAADTTVVSGEAAVASLLRYRAPIAPVVSPLLVIGLAGNCWSGSHASAMAAADYARQFVERAVPALRSVLRGLMDQQFAAVQGAVRRVLAGAS